MNRPGLPLRFRLSLGGSLRLTLAIAAFGAIAYQTSRKMALDAADGRAKAAAFSLAGRSSQGLRAILTAVETAARDPAIIAALRTGQVTPEAVRVLGDLPRDSVQTVAVGLRSLAGEAVVSLYHELPTGAFDESQRQDTVHFGRLTARGDSVFYEAVAPVFDRGKLIGSVVRVRRLATVPASVQVINDVLGSGGELLFGNRDGTLWTDLVKVIDSPESESPNRYRRDGQSFIAGTYPLQGTPFVFTVGFTEKTVLQPVRELLGKFVTIGLGIVLVALLLAWLSYSRLTRPLTALAGATESITARYTGGLPPPPVEGDELGRLQRSFETMEATIRTAHASLEERVREASDALTQLTAERSRLEQALVRVEASEEALRVADRRKDEFLATLAHELRNPLAPIRNAVQILKIKGGSNPELRWGHDVIDRQVSQMSRLLEDLLDVSRISHARLELRRERVDLAAVIRHAVETSRPLIDAGGHHLTMELPAEPLVLDGDPVRLAQVFSNLLNNSAKYTERGGRIRIAAGREGDQVAVTVTDDGIGIAPDKLAAIFERFSQVRPVRESAHSRLGTGLGIGLSLVRGLVELHGGRVEAASDGIGRGSRFTVRLPLVVEAIEPGPVPVAESAAPATTRRRLLIADDLEDSTDSLAEWLRLRGHEVYTAYDGDEAVAAASHARPDLILLDLGMPTMDGYEACRRIRAERWGRGVVIVALTGWGQGQDRRRTEEAGFDVHMVKPVDPAALLALLASPPPRLDPAA